MGAEIETSEFGGIRGGNFDRGLATGVGPDRALLGTG